MKGKKDKRDHTRVTTRATVWILKEGKRYCHITGDISLGGIKITSPVPYEEGKILDIEFFIPESGLTKPVKCKIAVAKVTLKENTYFLHCYFFDIPRKSYDRFCEAVNNLIIEAWFIEETESRGKEIFYHNKRAHQRVPLKMWITSKDIDENIYLPAENISVGGMYIITPARHEPGTVLEIVFNIPPHDKKIEAVIVVENIRPEGNMFGLGVKLIDMDEKDRLFLERSITSDITARWFKK